MPLTIDETDPCAAAIALRAVYARLVAGEQREEVEFRAGPNGVQRRVTYSKGDPNRLLALIREYEAKCTASQGGKPRRYALRGGGI